MQRVVLDSNVIISAILFGGSPADIFERIISRKIVGVSSHVLMEELERVFRKKFSYSDEALTLIQKKLLRAFILVVPKEKISVLKDEPDNRVLEAAVEGRCDAIVTGDKQFLDIKTFHGIAICSPREFLDTL